MIQFKQKQTHALILSALIGGLSLLYRREVAAETESAPHAVPLGHSEATFPVTDFYLGPREEEARRIRQEKGDEAYLEALLHPTVLGFAESIYPFNEAGERVVVSGDPDLGEPTNLSNARKWVARNYLDLWAANLFYAESPDAIDLGVETGKVRLAFFYQYDLHIQRIVGDLIMLRSDDKMILAAGLTVGEVVRYLARCLDIKHEAIKVEAPDDVWAVNSREGQTTGRHTDIWLTLGIAGGSVLLLLAFMAAKRSRARWKR